MGLVSYGFSQSGEPQLKVEGLQIVRLRARNALKSKSRKGFLWIAQFISPIFRPYDFGLKALLRKEQRGFGVPKTTPRRANRGTEKEGHVVTACPGLQQC